VNLVVPKNSKIWLSRKDPKNTPENLTRNPSKNPANKIDLYRI
jgi:hypothetical protein